MKPTPCDFRGFHAPTAVRARAVAQTCATSPGFLGVATCFLSFWHPVPRVQKIRTTSPAFPCDALDFGHALSPFFCPMSPFFVRCHLFSDNIMQKNIRCRLSALVPPPLCPGSTFLRKQKIFLQDKRRCKVQFCPAAAKSRGPSGKKVHTCHTQSPPMGGTTLEQWGHLTLGKVGAL